MLKPLSPIAPSGKLPVSNNVGIPLELLPIFGFLTWCPAVAGGGRGGLGSLTPVFPCHLTASPGEARADEQPVCGGVRGGLPALGMVSLVAVLPHVWRWRWVPTCPPAPFPPPPSLSNAAQMGPPVPEGLMQAPSRGTEHRDRSELHRTLRRWFLTLSRSGGVGFFEQSRLFSKYSKVKNAI